jgi:uncharacterized membrane protein
MIIMKYTDLNKMVSPDVNISENQRLISGIAGGLLLAMGIFDFSKSSFRRSLRMTAGSLLIIRAVTGYCPVSSVKTTFEEPDYEEKPLNFVKGAV